MDEKIKELLSLERSLISTRQMWECHDIVRYLTRQKSFGELSVSLRDQIRNMDGARHVIIQYNTMVNEAIAIRDKYKSEDVSGNTDFPFENLLISLEEQDN